MIVGECYQLKLDVDSYNQNRNKDNPVQISFNFEPDLLEKEAVREMEREKESGALPSEATPV